MPRFHFNLSSSDQHVSDNIGYDLDDLIAAHSRALQIADRLLMIAAFVDRRSKLTRWRVQVTDDTQRRVIDVIIPGELVLHKRPTALNNGARGLLQRLAREFADC